ncbi:MAG: hypothetical protein NVSMB18_06590 [Acetobacteraceae bacterium]
MKFPTLALVAAFALAPATGFAHGPAPAATHGGQVQDAHGSWVELVIRGDQVEVYVTDEHGGPVPATQVSGTATVMVGGQPQKAQLLPAEGNELTGKLAAPASSKTVATVSLKIGGNAATARFASAGWPAAAAAGRSVSEATLG